MLADCECRNDWIHRTDDCAFGASSGPEKMKGCPTLEEIQRCEPYADVSWCYTKDDSCAQQSDAQLGGGWANCDTVSGRVYAIGEAQEDIGGIIATSVPSTFRVMAVCGCMAPSPLSVIPSTR